MITRGMKNAQKGMQKQAQQQARQQEARARANIDAEDATYRLAEETRLKQNEGVIRAEVDQKFNNFVQQDEAEEAEAERIKIEESEETGKKRVDFLKAEVQEILKQKGENKVTNEEVMHSRERFLIVRDEIGKGMFSKVHQLISMLIILI